MSPRVIRLPLSGRDRRYYARELKNGERKHAELLKRIDREHSVLNRLHCEEWSTRQFIGGDLEPSPTIEQAIDADCPMLIVECRTCGHGDRIDLADVVFPRDRPIHVLSRKLECRQCKREGYPKRRPNLIGLDTRPHQPSPKTMAKRR
jgi:hypothetical protein